MAFTKGRRRLRGRAAGAVALAVTLVTGGLAAAAHGQESTQVSAEDAVQAQAATLRDLADQRGLRMGTAVGSQHLSQSQYAQTAASEFNSITHENDLKWETVEPQRGQFNWTNADRIVDFAQQNGQMVHGHTLVWHSQLPSWVGNGNFSRSELLDVMDTHISTTVGRYSDDIATWDVVNEPIGDNAQFRDSVFYRTLGQDFIAEAFRMADRADPDARLFINDYNIDGINAKSDAYYELVKDLLAQGVPIDGIGFQGHLISGQVPSSIQQNIQRFVDLGLEVMITELDIRIQMPATEQKLEQQARDYEQVVNACYAVSGCSGVIVWGVTDAYSWVPDTFEGQGAALPIDDSYQKKPAYWAIHEALGGEPDPDPTDPPTEDPTDPPTDPPSGDCEADYTITNEWNNGFQAEVTVTAGTSLTGWTVTWSLGSGESVSHAWNASVSSSGSNVTATDAGYNGTLSAGQSTSFGFVGTHGGSVSTPQPTCTSGS
ncbi:MULTISPECIES: endo-1,4-beta-xylanase [Nocardiopsis]|uniref:Beta-xylanase n=1 Tax=Nocardiopsis sinuspersici TaxID=501010 RepID=A0A1V3BZW9_9ACTN|nr:MULTISPECIES: endo-1,4-beta-xylanase [Nocardiopsis]OOC54101.1 endo-1,4-beta-xylanase [Nocardiopsis sinuspersici]